MSIAVVAAAVALSVPGAGHRVDLAAGTIDGKHVLGRSVAGVTAALGRPDFRTRRAIGWGGLDSFSYEVQFRRIGGQLRAETLVLERGSFVDPRLGPLLRWSPRGLLAAAAVRYRDEFALAQSYRCRRGICTAALASTAGPLHVTFGMTRARGTFVTLWLAR